MSATVKGCPALGGGEDSHGVEGLLGAAFKVEGNVLMPYEPCGQRPSALFLWAWQTFWISRRQEGTCSSGL